MASMARIESSSGALGRVCRNGLLISRLTDGQVEICWHGQRHDVVVVGPFATAFFAFRSGGVIVVTFERVRGVSPSHTLCSLSLLVGQVDVGDLSAERDGWCARDLLRICRNPSLHSEACVELAH